MEEQVKHGFPLPQISVLEDKKVRPNPALENGQETNIQVGGAVSYYIQGNIDEVLDFLDKNRHATFESNDQETLMKASISEVTHMKLNSPEMVALQHVKSVVEKMMESLSEPGQAFIEDVILNLIDSSKLTAVHEIKGVIDEIKETLQDQVAKIPELGSVLEKVDKEHNRVLQKVRDKRTERFNRNQRIANTIQDIPVINRLNGLFSNGKEDIQIEINPHVNVHEQIAGTAIVFDSNKISAAQLADRVRTDIINIHAETTQQLIESETQEQRHLVDLNMANDALLEQNTWPQNQQINTRVEQVTTSSISAEDKKVSATSKSLLKGPFDESVVQLDRQPKQDLTALGKLASKDQKKLLPKSKETSEKLHKRNKMKM